MVEELIDEWITDGYNCRIVKRDDLERSYVMLEKDDYDTLIFLDNGSTPDPIEFFGTITNPEEYFLIGFENKKHESTTYIYERLKWLVSYIIMLKEKGKE